MTNILHIATYFNETNVFEAQFEKLKEKYDVQQTVFISKRKAKTVEVKKSEHINYIFFNKFKKIDGMLYYNQINKSVKNIEENINLKNINIIHAHSLFTDGGIALKLKEKYGINYVVSIRADSKSFFLKKPHAVLLFKKIIENAEKIICISPSMKKYIEHKLDKKTKQIIKNKICIIPNGIDNFWHENKQTRKLNESNTIKFIQVSNFIKRKNIDKSIKIIKYLNQNQINAELVIVGDGEEKEKLKALTSKLKCDEFIEFCGKINSKNELMKKYRQADIFIMPSKKETFGLTYIEAMTQGLPIIYKYNTGVFGCFNKKVGFSINKFNYKKIMKKTIKLLNNYENISKNCVEESSNYNWDYITSTLYKIYTKINNKKVDL